MFYFDKELFFSSNKKRILSAKSINALTIISFALYKKWFIIWIVIKMTNYGGHILVKSKFKNKDNHIEINNLPLYINIDKNWKFFGIFVHQI